MEKHIYHNIIQTVSISPELSQNNFRYQFQRMDTDVLRLLFPNGFGKGRSFAVEISHGKSDLSEGKLRLD